MVKAQPFVEKKIRVPSRLYEEVEECLDKSGHRNWTELIRQILTEWVKKEGEKN